MRVTFRNLFSLYEKHDDFVVIFMGAFLAMALLKKAVNLAIQVMKARREDKKEKLALVKSAMELLKFAGWTTGGIQKLRKEGMQEIAEASHLLEEMEKQRKVLSATSKIDRDERFPFNSNVKVFVDGTENSYNATACDISLHGLKLLVPNLPAMKNHCRLKVCFDEKKTEIEGRMAWQGDVVIGKKAPPSLHIGIRADAMIQLSELLDKRQQEKLGSNRKKSDN